MREIEFRTFYRGQMCKVDNLAYVAVPPKDLALSKCKVKLTGHVWMKNCNVIEIFSELDNIMQYTGLKDKNGIKIYEGDIFLAMFKAPFIVIWDEANGRFLGVQTNDGSRHFSTSKNYICYLSDTSREVIGNIHENPELMEVKNNV